MTADDGLATFWLQEQLGFTLTRGDGWARASLECDERHLNPHGTVHGAVLFALIDTAMGAATMGVIDEGSLCATIEINTRFLEPVFAGTLTADVQVIKAGRRIVHLEADLTNGAERSIARASGSFAVIAKPH